MRKAFVSPAARNADRAARNGSSAGRRRRQPQLRVHDLRADGHDDDDAQPRQEGGAEHERLLHAGLRRHGQPVYQADLEDGC